MDHRLRRTPALNPYVYAKSVLHRSALNCRCTNRVSSASCAVDVEFADDFLPPSARVLSRTLEQLTGRARPACTYRTYSMLFGYKWHNTYRIRYAPPPLDGPGAAMTANATPPPRRRREIRVLPAANLRPTVCHFRDGKTRYRHDPGPKTFCFSATKRTFHSFPRPYEPRIHTTVLSAGRLLCARARARVRRRAVA